MPADKAISLGDAACGAKRLALTAGLAACVMLAACGGGLVPVHNIHNAPIVATRGQQPGIQNVRDAIMRALVSRGWQVDREGPDGVVATTVSRGNSATVLVQYDARAYSISYLDSSPSLKFNGASIHRRYNDWIDKLDKTIRKLLADAEYLPVQVVVPLAPPPGAAGTMPAEPNAPAPNSAPPLGAAGPVPAPPPATGAPEVAPQTRPQAAPQYEAPPPPPPPAPAPRK